MNYTLRDPKGNMILSVESAPSSKDKESESVYDTIVNIAKNTISKFKPQNKTAITPFTIISKNNELYNKSDFISGKTKCVNVIYFNINAYYKDFGTNEEYKIARHDETKFISEFKTSLLKNNVIKQHFSSIKDEGDDDGGAICVYLK